MPPNMPFFGSGVFVLAATHGIISPMKPIALDVLSSPGCQICKQFEEYWKTVEKDWPNVTHRQIEVTTPEGQEMVQKYMIFSSPAIMVNGEMFSMGGFDREKFVAKLKKLS